jgi:hypothetical protein
MNPLEPIAVFALLVSTRAAIALLFEITRCLAILFHCYNKDNAEFVKLLDYNVQTCSIGTFADTDRLFCARICPGEQ